MRLNRVADAASVSLHARSFWFCVPLACFARWRRAIWQSKASGPKRLSSNDVRRANAWTSCDDGAEVIIVISRCKVTHLVSRVQHQNAWTLAMSATILVLVASTHVR